MKREDVLELINTAERKGLTSLNLSNREISEIPSEIGNLVNLEHLDLSYNELKGLPIELFNLSKLKTILLIRNKITNLPTSISNLRNLRLLDISYNSLTELPPDISRLENLESIDLGHNRIAKLPIQITKLLNLKKLYIEENPLVFPPQKVASKGLYAIMHYLMAEDKRVNAEKVMVQIYNMPAELQQIFRKQLSTFAETISFDSKNQMSFDLTFIQHDLQDYIELEAGVDNYLYDFLKFIKQNAHSLTYDSPEKLKSGLVDIQMMELRHDINKMNDELQEKVNEIKDLQESIMELSHTLGNKVRT